VGGFKPEEQVLLKRFLIKLRDNLQQGDAIKAEQPEPVINS